MGALGVTAGGAGLPCRVVQVPLAVEEVDLRGPDVGVAARRGVRPDLDARGLAQPGESGGLPHEQLTGERGRHQVVVAVVVLQPGVGALLRLDRVGERLALRCGSGLRDSDEQGGDQGQQRCPEHRPATIRPLTVHGVEHDGSFQHLLRATPPPLVRYHDRCSYCRTELRFAGFGVKGSTPARSSARCSVTCYRSWTSAPPASPVAASSHPRPDRFSRLSRPGRGDSSRAAGRKGGAEIAASIGTPAGGRCAGSFAQLRSLGSELPEGYRTPGWVTGCRRWRPPGRSSCSQPGRTAGSCSGGCSGPGGCTTRTRPRRSPRGRPGP